MKILNHNKMLILTNSAVALYFLTVLMFKGSHNIGFALLVAMGIIFAIYHVAIQKQRPIFSVQDKWLAASFVFYVLIFLLSIIFNGGRMRELDHPSRALLVLPLILLFMQYPIRLRVLLHCIPLGSFIAGAVALVQRFILNYDMAFQHQMQIQAGDMAMSLGMFSFAIALYFLVKKQQKYTALYLVAALFGILASVLSTARGGWIGVPVLLVLMLWAFRQSINKKWVGAISLSLVGLIAIAVAIPQTKMLQRINQAEHEVTAYFEKNHGYTSLGARFDMWKSAVLMAKEKPLLGWGQEGSNLQRKEHAKQKLVHPIVGEFTHAHNQYLDDLSKRGALGLLALLGILGVPLVYFSKAVSSQNLEIKLIGLLGSIHIISVMFYGLSQAFFSHNSGVIFYFLVTIIFYSALKNKIAQRQEHQER